jgi:hypothetical protein
MKTRLIVLKRSCLPLIPALALLGLPTAQAQQTIDIKAITCEKFLAGQLTDSRSLAIWLNGYVNGERGKTLIDPDTVRESTLIEYCVAHSKMPALDAARIVAGGAGK